MIKSINICKISRLKLHILHIYGFLHIYMQFYIYMYMEFLKAYVAKLYIYCKNKILTT